jgi:hypothetical protein
MLNLFEPDHQHKLLNTINKVLFDVNTVLGKKSDEPFEVGVRLKTSDEQNYIFSVFCCIFRDHDDIRVITKEDDDQKLIVCIERK